jgi:hypothetical protein
VKKEILVLSCLLCITAYGETIPGSVAVDVNAAQLVRAVRESENWIHKADSVYIRIECEKTEAKAQGALSEGNPMAVKSPADLKNDLKSSKIKNTLEYAFDAKHVRFVYEQPNCDSQTKVWDGSKLIVCEKTVNPAREKYSLGNSPQTNFEDFLARETAWPRAQAHSFWFDSKNVDDFLCYYGEPKDFVLKGKSNYRGIECYELEFTPKDFRGIMGGETCDTGKDEQEKFGFIGQARGLADQSYRWYVGTNDKLLYGLVWLISGKPNTECRMTDYKQVSPGCWYPMMQGYTIYQENDSNEPLPASISSLKVADVRVNEKLDDKLFKMELKEGVEVADSRGGWTVSYKYKPLPTELAGSKINSLDEFGIKTDGAQTKEKGVLVCFVDMEQRPSRNCVKELTKNKAELEQKNIFVTIVQASNIDNKKLNQLGTENNISFPTGQIKADAEKTLFKWGVRSLPWLILTDKKHIITAEGFTINELQKKIDGIN